MMIVIIEQILALNLIAIMTIVMVKNNDYLKFKISILKIGYFYIITIVIVKYKNYVYVLICIIIINPTNKIYIARYTCRQ